MKTSNMIHKREKDRQTDRNRDRETLREKDLKKVGRKRERDAQSEREDGVVRTVAGAINSDSVNHSCLHG